jgi:hypothetical protein
LRARGQRHSHRSLCWQRAQLFERVSARSLAPLYAALPRNTHLRRLHCSRSSRADLIPAGRATDDAFEHDLLLPAVRANASLRELRLDTGARFWRMPSVAWEASREAMALVHARAAAAAAPR